jgi:hypothetical protein
MSERTYDTLGDGEGKGFDGPFLFCDYWASVLNLRDIVNNRGLSSAGLSLELFRKILNRPAAALPRLGYFILSTLVKPLTLIFRAVRRLVSGRSDDRRDRYDRSAMRDLLLEHSLDLRPRERGMADVYAEGRLVAENVVNPVRLRGLSSMFVARYKVFLASGIALGYGALIGPVSRLFGAESVIVPYLGVLFYPIVLLILWAIFDDLLTAAVAPLPLIAIRMVIHVGQGFQAFVIAVVGTAFVLYLVEWFFVPRSLPGALYLYVNDPESRDFPYCRGHEPYWLEGRYYWVWRFVTLAPAELLKFWEKDWERLEIWIRAEGEDRGKIEWLVNDWHYRELWFRYRDLASKHAQGAHQNILRRHLDSERLLTWVIELDMDLVFHSPLVRGVRLTRGRNLSLGWRILSGLDVFFRQRAREDPEKHKQSLEMLEIQGTEFLEDVPEHLRITVTRRLLSLPWTYWRFPRGVKSTRKLFVYGRGTDPAGKAEPASDPRFQIKEPGHRHPGSLEILS